MNGLVERCVNVDLVAFGIIAIAIGVGALSASRHLYPRLELSEDAMATVRLLTAMIAGVLVLSGLGLVVIGIVG
ncbi:beta-ketoadipyl CoA thiolase [Natrialba magadii ATCC 43099]|uniref:Beta-ketoadipyl CoA thiolase n=1 Tax=Natrialba magadii (strain ATCC 43099 / DSM 3394 / CCM 3739 / CIP 104546 / IAM 13178 / JCM 8861 / NBRC 102185 / NCIMB 2190 / MS3) TaxID=547559 RepID=D3T0P7_NATMM|nr:hypothetical protein [Natrialba magadii]ADD06526.1 beta-ketoadipyl CoA thiolase [Natrialba magadii ATCC 43099]ELY32012.1 beta-ketoadipyl CoA thiolase [Natrialba magadii ATCC 43099]